ncbi:MAG TPA: hypothetical protein VGD01_00130 [Candidatus Elarobacter sp.]
MRRVYDDSFRDLYERNWGDGLPAYVYETFFDWGRNRWVAMLYNASTSAWDLIYVSNSNNLVSTAEPVEGWDMFEAHYEGTSNNICPPMLTLHSYNNQWINPATGNWESVASVPQQQLMRHEGYAGMECLNGDDGSQRGYFYLLTGVSLAEWYVDSYPSASAPPPGEPREERGDRSASRTPRFNLMGSLRLMT